MGMVVRKARGSFSNLIEGSEPTGSSLRSRLSYTHHKVTPEACRLCVTQHCHVQVWP